MTAARENPSLTDRIKRLAEKYDISDRVALANAVWRGMHAAAHGSLSETDDRVADTLDKLDVVLQRALHLLGDVINRNRLGEELLKGNYPPKLGPFDLMDQLTIYAMASERAHRGRAQKRGRLARRDVVAAKSIYVDYWKNTLGREYTENHKWEMTFSPGEKGKLRPKGEGENFVFDAISVWASDLAPGLQSIRTPAADR